MLDAFFANHPTSRSLSKPLALAALLVLLALSVGGALGERMEQRAVQDRLTFGDVADNCTACTPSQPLN